MPGANVLLDALALAVGCSGRAGVPSLKRRSNQGSSPLGLLTFILGNLDCQASFFLIP